MRNTTTLRGKLQARVTLSAGSAEQAVSPGAFGGLPGTMSDSYRLYRFKRFRVTLLPVFSGSTTDTFGVTYISGPTDSIAGVGIDEMENDNSAFITGTQSVPVHMDLKSAPIKGTHDWYVTKLDAAEPFLDTQFTIYYANQSTIGVVIPVIYEYEIEFKDPLDSTLIAAMVKSPSTKSFKTIKEKSKEADALLYSKTEVVVCSCTRHA